MALEKLVKFKATFWYNTLLYFVVLIFQGLGFMGLLNKPVYYLRIGFIGFSLLVLGFALLQSSYLLDVLIAALKNKKWSNVPGVLFHLAILVVAALFSLFVSLLYSGIWGVSAGG